MNPEGFAFFEGPLPPACTAGIPYQEEPVIGTSKTRQPCLRPQQLGVSTTRLEASLNA